MGSITIGGAIPADAQHGVMEEALRLVNNRWPKLRSTELGCLLNSPKQGQQPYLLVAGKLPLEVEDVPPEELPQDLNEVAEVLKPLGLIVRVE